jgi:plasmid maintenance system antidote protein VapI
MQVLSELKFIDASDSLPWEFMSGEPVLSIGEKLKGKGARYRENLTQKELSALTGIPQAHISKIKNNKFSVGKDRARRLAQILHIDYQVLL